MINTAVILAAGRGTRLALTKPGEIELRDRPKGFLTLGSRPIVEESIDFLEAAGVREVVVVTGYGAEHYDELARRRRGLVRTVYNARFAESGSMFSLYVARDAARGPFLLLESDLVYEPRALSALLACPAPDAILVSGPTGAGDEVYVEARGGDLMNMSKRRADLGPGVVGELCGISKISGALFERMLRISAAAFERSLTFDYETDCLVAAAREASVHCLVIEDLVWGEIDDPSHLDRVRCDVYPEVRRRALRHDFP